MPDPNNKAWILPMHDPKYILKNEKEDHLRSTYDRDLAHAVKCSKYTDAPEHFSIKGAKILKDFNDVVTQLKK
ncbi:hypothetical protein, partial [Listeria monocytogenes]|uniref:hypothetical protein n=1 Tax=Listeria monocytogenes TaxID=1639 RepID=UPI001057AC7C